MWHMDDSFLLLLAFYFCSAGFIFGFTQCFCKNQRQRSEARTINHRGLRFRSKSRLQRLFIYLYRCPSFCCQLPLASIAYSLLGDAHGINEANGREVAPSSIRRGIRPLLQEGKSRDSLVSEKKIIRMKKHLPIESEA